MPKRHDLTIVRCVICDRKIQAGAPLDHINSWIEAYDAVVFHSAGNFGSRVYDEDGDEYLQAFICDRCVLKRASRMRRVKLPPNDPAKVADFEKFRPMIPKNELGRIMAD